jgi:hypothetical protein
MRTATKKYTRKVRKWYAGFLPLNNDNQQKCREYKREYSLFALRRNIYDGSRERHSFPLNKQKNQFHVMRWCIAYVSLTYYCELLVWYKNKYVHVVDYLFGFSLLSSVAITIRQFSFTYFSTLPSLSCRFYLFW